MKHYLPYILFILFFLTACSPTSLRAEATTTYTPSITSTLERTPIQPKSTSTPTATPIPDLTRLKNKFISIEAISDLNAPWRNELVLKDSIVLANKGQTLILNLETNNKAIISDDAYTQFVSPDNTKLAYEDSRGKIIVTDNKGKILSQTSNSDQRLILLGWLDNENLILEQVAITDTGLSQWSLVILNPFYGTTQKHPPNFPDMRETPNEIMWTPSLMLPNKDLSRLLYPTWEQGFAMWDLKTNSLIAHFSWLVPVFKPEWSPDGKEFVQSVPLHEAISYYSEQKDITHYEDGLPYEGGSDILSVNQNGEIKRITYLTTKYPAQETNLTWSPNGEKIAFWLYLFEGSLPQLGIVDVQTGELTNYTVGPSTDYYAWSNIFWSPDGTQLAFTQETPEKNVVIVDIKNSIAFYTTQGADVVGWMKNDK